MMKLSRNDRFVAAAEDGDGLFAAAFFCSTAASGDAGFSDAAVRSLALVVATQAMMHRSDANVFIVFVDEI